MNDRNPRGSSACAAPFESVVWERRRSPRHPPTEHRLWLGWRTERDFVVVHADLMNISQGGALMLVSEPPPRGSLTWLRLEGPTPIEDVCALVIETVRMGRNEHGVRVAFREPFPPEFYQAAVEGLSLAEGAGLFG
jgi:hypothetical protein